jgi:hypothetical protein
MNKEKKNVKEPFKPENTPKPPQQVHPDPHKKNNGDKDKQNKKADSHKPSHLLSDQAEIDDETTI